MADSKRDHTANHQSYSIHSFILYSSETLCARKSSRAFKQSVRAILLLLLPPQLNTMENSSELLSKPGELLSF